LAHTRGGKPPALLGRFLYNSIPTLKARGKPALYYPDIASVRPDRDNFVDTQFRGLLQDPFKFCGFDQRDCKYQRHTRFPRRQLPQVLNENGGIVDGDVTDISVPLSIENLYNLTCTYPQNIAQMVGLILRETGYPVFNGFPGNVKTPSGHIQQCL
jgi:hypothetical protein